MMRLPKVLVSSVVRAAHQGDAHGGLYLVDLETESFETVYDWDDPSIDFSGRGGDRGLRGINRDGDFYYVAATSRILVLNADLKIVNEISHPYLLSCHEIQVYAGQLYITSTAYDLLAVYDLSQSKFLHFYRVEQRFRSPFWRSRFSKIFKWLGQSHWLYTYGLIDESEPISPQDTALINNVFVDDTGIYLCGVRMNVLLHLSHQTFQVKSSRSVSYGTHNCQPFMKEGLIYNDTKRNRLCIKNKSQNWYVPIATKPGRIDDKIARPGFGRGICILNEAYLVSGYSPSSLMVINYLTGEVVKHIELSHDVKNAVHGIHVFT